MPYRKEKIRYDRNRTRSSISELLKQCIGMTTTRINASTENTNAAAPDQTKMLAGAYNNGINILQVQLLAM